MKINNHYSRNGKGGAAYFTKIGIWVQMLAVFVLMLIVFSGSCTNENENKIRNTINTYINDTIKIKTNEKDTIHTTSSSLFMWRNKGH